MAVPGVQAFSFADGIDLLAPGYLVMAFWLDTGLTPKTRYVPHTPPESPEREARLRSLFQGQGLALGLVRRIQVAAMQSASSMSYKRGVRPPFAITTHKDTH